MNKEVTRNQVQFTHL